jgi:glycosyltransferase involved in cell wall biosynthesis
MTPHYVMMLGEVYTRLDDFDILHFHIDHLHYPLMRAFSDRMLTTLHGRLDLPDLAPFYSRFPELPLVSISDAQRLPMPPVNWMSTIYHGLPKDLLPFTDRPDPGYLAFLGRISPEKGPDRAIEIAARTGHPLKIAAKIDAVDEGYWRDVIAPMISAHPNVEFIGEINEHEKGEFLGNARTLLFPIDWPEPFGLVIIEAMACGTPVIAFDKGSVAEVIDDGLTGFVVGSIAESVAALDHLDKLDRKSIRDQFDQRFTVERMTQDYLTAYRHLPRMRRLEPRLAWSRPEPRTSALGARTGRSGEFPHLVIRGRVEKGIPALVGGSERGRGVIRVSRK